MKLVMFVPMKKVTQKTVATHLNRQLIVQLLIKTLWSSEDGEW